VDKPKQLRRRGRRRRRRLFSFTSLRFTQAMSARLLRYGAPSVGLVTGSEQHPQRYRLISELSPPRPDHPKGSDAPRVWTAEDTTYAHFHRLYSIKLILVFRSFGQVVVLKLHRGVAKTWRKESSALWRVAGYPYIRDDRPPLIPSDHTGQQHCVQILDSFQLPDENGYYDDAESQRLISSDGFVALPVLGPSLRQWQGTRSSPCFPLSIAQRIMRQVVMAVDFLHSGLGEGGNEDGWASTAGLVHGCAFLPAFISLLRFLLTLPPIRRHHSRESPPLHSLL
jgi:hypothetical protein